jgi:eukaryotic-like serine/threonine-protein kinase
VPEPIVHPQSAAPADESLAAADLTPLPPFDPPPPVPAGVRDWFRGNHLPHPPGYRLKREIGRGAMGVVFEAEQLDLRRAVAVKLLHPGDPLGPERLSRFRAEGEAAARLSHPNVVEIHATGDVAGRPYLVMELVGGGNLAARLANAPLPPADAARLVATLARAIDHAHRSGVLHRDLKPANVLLTADGTPKVTDFGLAKLLDAGSDATGTGAVLGTPAYMAPEQAAGRPATPAADVYALGAVLYECLTGGPPFRAATALATLDLVRAADPVPPRRLNPAVPRDLETVCLACLRKDPARRYATAAALADDLGRVLDGRPVAARPAGVGERCWKWVRRRPAAAGLLAVSILSVVAAAAGVAVHTDRLRREADRANRGEADAVAERERADANYQAARSALQRMLDRLRTDRRDIPAVKDLQRAQAEDALAFYLAVAGREGGAPEVRHDAARAAREAAHLQMLLGRWADGESVLTRARTQLTALTAEFPDRLDYKFDLACTLNDLGTFRADASPGKPSPWLARSKAVWEELLAVDPKSADYRDGLATCHHVLGNYYFANRQPGEAARNYQTAVDLREALLADQPRAHDFRRRHAGSLLNLSVQLQQVPQRVREAHAAHERAEALFVQLLREVPDELETVCDLAIMRMNWAYVQAAEGDLDAALAGLDKNVAVLEAALKREPNAIQAQNALYRTYGTRAVLLEAAGRHAESVAAWERVVALAPAAERPGYEASLAAARLRAATSRAKDK